MSSKTGFGIIIMVFSVSLCCIAQNDEANAGNNAKGKWSLSAGLVYRAGMEARISGPSYTQMSGLHGNNLPETGLSGVGPRNSYADRTYDDGYVFIDSFTLADSITWYWGYEKSSQWDAADGQLKFTNQGGWWNSEETISNDNLSAEEDMDGLGAGVTLSRNFEKPGKIHGISIGFEYIPLDEEATGTAFSEQYEAGPYVVRDRYNFAGTPPPAPYAHGDTLGPTIPNKPTSRNSARVIAESGIASNEVKLDIDSSLSNIWIGPDISLMRGEKFSLFTQPRFTANYFSADLKRTEVFKTNQGGTETIINSWEEKANESDWAFGLGISIGGEIAVGNSWSVIAAVQYDYVFDEIEKEIGPNKAEFDFGGYGAKIFLKKDF